MAQLFNVSISTISRHISNIVSEGELEEKSILRFLQIANSDKPVAFYNLDMVIAVGYRVNSKRATQFRIWATKTLREYLVKGYLLDDNRFKNGFSLTYWKELIDRIMEIRVSEKMFYQQIKDIYKLSADYDKDDDRTLDFFAKIQNKLLWAVSGKTAAELVYYRSNAKLPHMGLLSSEDKDKVKLKDIGIGKNYLQKEELNNLKLIVEQYLSFAAKIDDGNRRSIAICSSFCAL